MPASQTIIRLSSFFGWKSLSFPAAIFVLSIVLFGCSNDSPTVSSMNYPTVNGVWEGEKEHDYAKYKLKLNLNENKTVIFGSGSCIVQKPNKPVETIYYNEVVGDNDYPKLSMRLDSFNFEGVLSDNGSVIYGSLEVLYPPDITKKIFIGINLSRK